VIDTRDGHPEVSEDKLSAQAASAIRIKAKSTQVIDLGIGWEWQYDTHFVGELERACKERGLSTYAIHRSSVQEVTAHYRGGDLRFRFYLDRGSDALKEFEPLARLVAASGARIINDYSHLKRCLDKATMHLEFLTAGLNVPYTIILSPYDHAPEIKITDLAKLGRSFIIKPALGSGGTGVVVGAETLAEVLAARQSQNDQKFLLQEKIEPITIGSYRAWFRVYYVVGRTFLAWWDDLTHLYRSVAPEEEQAFGLSPMRDIISTIARISQLDFFSAEIARTADGRFVVVDYVNDVCDMRPQSKHYDGVPDLLVSTIIQTLVDFISRRLHQQDQALAPEHTMITTAANGP
jgi:glutathione synthase/RimK-type ligase-like ATP-grasp enzyme